VLYRESGQFKKTYSEDMQVFPLREDRIGIAVILFIAAVVIPLTGSNFFLSTVMIPFLVFALAAMGLNIVTGYTGLISLGTGAFMGVGAYACYKLTTYFPGVPIVIWILVSGVFSAAIGALFGLPSLRIKGFYLAVATLAAQFFLEWCFVRIPWLFNYNASGAIEVPTRWIAGIPVTGPNATPMTRYYVILFIVVLMTWIASNILHGRIGRSFMAVRDMDIAAELMGIRLLRTKLLAFAMSSFYCGVAGATMMFLWYGGGEASDAFNINQSFIILFMVIIGGLGSLIGCFFGAALLHIIPVMLKFGLPAIGIPLAGATAEHINHLLVGGLIILFLIVEPHGLARLWQITKQKLRTWPFPY
jgi:branched-chain amino acid transport system permease protein